jgi:type I restriction enzyme M protein
MRKSLGNKRHEISAEQIQRIHDLCTTFKDGEHAKIFPTTDFGYRKITIERPLRLNFQASADRIERLKEEGAFINLAASKKKDAKAKAAEEAEGRQQQAAILKALAALPGTLLKSRPEFESVLDAALKKAALKIAAPVRKSILSALSERDETAEICRDADGQPEPDPELRDTENVPLLDDIRAYFDREVKPHVPDAWINTSVRDHKDGEVGKVGYEINFNRYFYQYQPPRPLPEIEADIRTLEGEIVSMLREVAG